MASKTEQPARTGSSFESEANAVLRELRPALAGVLECVRPPITRGAELRKMLGLDAHLSWSIFNAANAHDTRALASLVPGRRPMERFLVAAAERGVPAEAIQRAREAYERYEASVARHARSREAYAAMVAGLGQHPADARDNGPSGEGPEIGTATRQVPDTWATAQAKHKRNAFRSLALLWGRQARLLFTSIAAKPSARDGWLDYLFVKGAVGIHQTRRGVVLRGAPRVRFEPPVEGGEPPARQALDPREQSPDAIGLLRDFCSSPLPTFVARTTDDGFVTHELITTDVGTTAAITYFAGHIVRAADPIPGSVPGAEVGLASIVGIPLEVDITEVLMHESIWDERPPEVKVYDSRAGVPVMEFQEFDELPTIEKALYLGRGLDSGRTAIIPRYVEMMSYAMERVGWDPNEFRLFRCRVDYPLLHSRIRMRFATDGQD